MSLPTPNTRKEQYLNAIATGNSGGLPTPITREEEYLDAIAKSGGGSGDGDMKKSVYDSDLAVANAGGIGAFVSDAISGKVDKVAGKGLSTNDYSDTEKCKVADNTSAIGAIVNVNGACNRCPVSATTTTDHGITFTVNSDGSITASGTADSGHVATIDIMPKTDLAYGTYKGSGGVNEHCRIIYGLSNSSGTLIDTVDDSGEGIELTVNASTPKVSMALIIDKGTDLTTPVTFYPMLYDARLNPTGYVPYAMTNRELTERVEKIKTGVYGGSLNDLTYTFMGFGYNVTGAATGAYGFIINIAEKVEGVIRINQQWCQNDQTTWHTRNSLNGGVSWSAWS